MGIEGLKDGQGMTMVADGTPIAVYKQEGKLLVFENRCPHLQCELDWNQLDQTWDCPCHNSRFTAEGQVLGGPARRSLTLLEFEVRNDHIRVSTPRDTGADF